MSDTRSDSNFFDRDVIIDTNGDIYQVMGSIHPPEVVLATPKYRKILVPEPNQFYWQRKKTSECFQRIIPQYSTLAITESIQKDTYRHFSTIFQRDLIQIPRSQISEHLSPKTRLTELYDCFRKGSFAEKHELDNIERETLDITSILIEEFGLSEADLGISGSILWGGQHINSDIDITIYGLTAQNKFSKYSKRFQSQSKGLRSFSLLELMTKAEKWAEKSGLSVEECFDYLHQKSYLFYFKNRFVSLIFVPSQEELIAYSPYLLDSQFFNVRPITIQATIRTDRWGLYYPGLYGIQCDAILDDEFENLPSKQNITRLLVFEHENVGYYSIGDKVEIAGLLQKCENVLVGNGFEIGITYQLVVGTMETFKHEYVRRVK